MHARAVRLALCLAAVALARGEGGGESSEAQKTEGGQAASVDEAVAFNEEGFDPAHVLTFFVPPREQECFYHVVEGSAENLRIAFFVRCAARGCGGGRTLSLAPRSDGGDMKLDALFKDSGGNVVFDRRNVDEGLFEFVAKCVWRRRRQGRPRVTRPRAPPACGASRDEGTYTFCFDNHRNTESRTMTFALHVGDRPSNEPPALPGTAIGHATRPHRAKFTRWRRPRAHGAAR